MFKQCIYIYIYTSVTNIQYFCWRLDFSFKTILLTLQLPQYTETHNFLFYFLPAANSWQWHTYTRLHFILMFSRCNKDTLSIRYKIVLKYLRCQFPFFSVFLSLFSFLSFFFMLLLFSRITVICILFKVFSAFV